jgi:hypothetical protein
MGNSNRKAYVNKQLGGDWRDVKGPCVDCYTSGRVKAKLRQEYVKPKEYGDWHKMRSMAPPFRKY